MTIKKFKENIKTYRKACDKDRDPFLIVHFSREEDKYHGAHERIDKGDAMIIINELARVFSIDLDIMAKMQSNDTP